MQLPPQILSPPTGITAFIGYSAQTTGGFRKVTSLAEFQKWFGKDDARSSVGPPRYLTDSIALYFLNGGSVAYVYSLGPRPVFSETPFLEALTKLESVPEPSLLALPDAVGLNASALQKVQLAALDHCGKQPNRFCVLDVPAPASSSRISTFLATLTGDSLANGAVYGPWVKVGTRTIPASGAVVGVFARVDRERGVWKAPVNAPVTGIQGLSEPAFDHGLDRLNTLRTVTGKGTVLWGARTLAGDSADGRYVPNRRLERMVEAALRQGLTEVRYQPNDPSTWIRVKALVQNFVHSLWRQGALAGTKPEEAYFVNVGLGHTMSQRDILENRLIVNVGLAELRPAEFTILRFVFTVNG